MDKVGVNVVVIGGGTGSFTLLRRIKNYTSHVTALVNMADDGGSTGQLRDELGVLPAGDIRQCLVALSQAPRTRDLFNYRFEEGTFAGHAFGNIFMAALEKMTGNFAEGVEEASRVLNIVGSVEPVTLDPVTLVMKTSDGVVTRGEFQIGHANFDGMQRPHISLDPDPTLNLKAAEAIATADIVVIAPGNLYGSLAPALIVPGMQEALNATKAKKVYVCNLVTKPGQTDGFTVSDFADEVERFSNCKLDYVLYNTAKPDKNLLKKYAHDGELPVEYSESRLKKQHFMAKGGEFIAHEPVRGAQNSADPIAATRTFIRHDGDAIARALMKIYFS